ncbi:MULTISPECIES: photosystem II reaction center protein Ycf12/Psb30 [Brasilonema]|nr:photosystem II reaction center protein Ycf12 [Brasilonema octagenarum]
MDAIFNIFSGLGNIHWEVIFQLVFVALIMLAGPAVIFVLAFRNGDL